MCVHGTIVPSDDKVDDNTGEQRELGVDNHHREMPKYWEPAYEHKLQELGRAGWVNRRFGVRLPSPAPEYIKSSA
jgi:hypothetical protein